MLYRPGIRRGLFFIGGHAMEYKMFCPIKINLTLRVLSTRDDGYHEIYSLFWKRKGIDGLTISRNKEDNVRDILNAKGYTINGQNIIMKTVTWARRLGYKIPPLHIELNKKLPIGSGIGAGSGNAATLILWLVKEYGLKADAKSVSKLGADVPFMSGDADMAIVSGIGEKILPVNDVPSLKWILVFPKWTTSTVKAYSKLDQYRKNNSLIINKSQLDNEIDTILYNLNKGNKIGLLPNDFFAPLLEEHPEYNIAQNIAEDSGALAWGISGSGSTFFALCKSSHSAAKAMSAFENQYWINQINKLE